MLIVIVLVKLLRAGAGAGAKTDEVDTEMGEVDTEMDVEVAYRKDKSIDIWTHIL